MSKYFNLFIFISLSHILISQESYSVEILHADSAIWETVNGETLRKLVNNVKLKHKTTYIDCDSATVYTSNNIDAFGHVFIRKTAKTNLRGNVLHYISAQKIAMLNGNCILTDDKSKLYTEDITYDLFNEQGYFMQGGKLVNDKSEITSQQGTFYTKANQVLFKQNVQVNHPKYKLSSDSLIYDTKLKRSIFKSSTKIDNDSGYIWCNSGWYDEANNQSAFGRGTYIYNPPQWMQTDSIFYDRKNGISRIYKTFEYHDTTMKVHLFGDSAYMYNDNKDMIAYKRPILIMESSDNKPTFIRGDILTLKTDIFKNRILTATKKVRMYSDEFQAVGDTMVYNSMDSSMLIYSNANIWRENYQISGTKIFSIFENRKPKTMKVFGTAFLINQEAGLNHYNQVSSDTNYVNFKDGKMDEMFAFGNAKSIYYGKEEGKGYLGINSTESYSLKMYFDSTTPKKIIFYENPKAIFYPIQDLNNENKFLPNFMWKDALRPKSKDDI